MRVFRLCVAVPVVLLAGATSAAAAVAPVSVTSGNARVDVQTTPFRLTFQRADTGAVVLQEVAGDRVPKAGAQLFPELGGAKAPGDGAPVYEPLGFQVGAAQSAQLVPFETAGDQTVAAQGGGVFSPTDVLTATPAAGGYRLTVATTAPGRTMTVDVVPDAGSAIRVRARLSDGSGVAGFSDSFVSPAAEAFHGFGGRGNAIDQRGNSLYGWAEQEAIDCGVVDASAQQGCAAIPGGGGEGYRLGSGFAQTYYPQNHFVSSRGYGFLLDAPELTRWRLAADDRTKWQVNVAGSSLDYSVVVGRTLADSVRGLTAITGAQVQPADWALGPTVSRALNVAGDPPEKYRMEIAEDLEHVDKAKSPITSYAYEAWRTQEPAFVRKTNAALRAKGIHAVGYLRAFVHVDSFDNQAIFDQADRNGYGARDAQGNPARFVCNYGPDCILIDFSNPAARRWWAGRVREMLDLGFDGFMEDFGEQATTDMHFFDGSTGATMHNRYPVLYHRLTREVVDEYMREHPDREIYFFTRAGYSGAGDGSRRGSAAYDNGSFPGDETVSWTEGTGLPSIVPDMLNRSVGGGLGYDTDIGGYTGLPGGYDGASTELFLRWAQAAVFTPYYRVHNADIHMPWDKRYAAGTEAKWERLARLHNSAVPLIADLWKRYPETGVPPTAPLWLLFADDPRAAAVSDQWMVGRDLLVAPVLSKGATSRSVYFPAGCWRHGETGSAFEGGTRRSVPAGPDSLPWFVRCGTDPLVVNASKRCASRRSFRIRLRGRRGDPVRSASVLVNGRRVRVLRGRRLRARVDLRGLPKGQVIVRVVARTAHGRRLVETRTYHTCVARRR